MAVPGASAYDSVNMSNYMRARFEEKKAVMPEVVTGHAMCMQESVRLTTFTTAQNIIRSSRVEKRAGIAGLYHRVGVIQSTFCRPLQEVERRAVCATRDARRFLR